MFQTGFILNFNLESEFMTTFTHSFADSKLIYLIVLNVHFFLNFKSDFHENFGKLHLLFSSSV